MPAPGLTNSENTPVLETLRSKVASCQFGARHATSFSSIVGHNLLLRGGAARRRHASRRRSWRLGAAGESVHSATFPWRPESVVGRTSGFQAISSLWVLRRTVRYSFVRIAAFSPRSQLWVWRPLRTVWRPLRTDVLPTTTMELPTTNERKSSGQCSGDGAASSRPDY